MADKPSFILGVKMPKGGEMSHKNEMKGNPEGNHKMDMEGMHGFLRELKSEIQSGKTEMAVSMIDKYMGKEYPEGKENPGEKEMSMGEAMDKAMMKKGNPHY